MEETKPDFWQIFQDANDEYEKQKSHSIDSDDYPDYILHAMNKVWEMTKRGEI